MTLLQKAILSTIVYYDTLDYPLTSFEVFKYLVNPLHIASFYCMRIAQPSISLKNIIENLNNKELRKFIDEKNGFYCIRKARLRPLGSGNANAPMRINSLKNTDELIRTRIDRQKIADAKWKKAKKIIRWLQFIPYVRMVAVSGSLALNNTHKDSDIDVLIVVRAGRIWLARFLVTMFLQFIGKRRHKNHTKDKICLNHYIIDKSLEIKFRSLYNAQTYAHIIPVLEVESGIYKKFQKANQWLKNYLVFWPSFAKATEGKPRHFKILKTNSLLKSIAKLKEVCLNRKFGDLLEKILRKLQKRLIKKDPLTHKPGGRVTIDDTQLEFHPDSPERRILDKYNQSMLYLGVKELSREKDSGLL